MKEELELNSFSLSKMGYENTLDKVQKERTHEIE